jgi:hypothetical protein
MAACENVKIRENIARWRGEGRHGRVHLQEPMRPGLPARLSDRTPSTLDVAGAPRCGAADRSAGHEERQPHSGRGTPCSWVNPPRAER